MPRKGQIDRFGHEMDTNALEEVLWNLERAGIPTTDTSNLRVLVEDDQGLLSAPWSTVEAAFADFWFYSGYGGAYLKPGIIVAYKDRPILIRREYDGSEWWETIPDPSYPLRVPDCPKVRRLLFARGVAES